MSNIQPYIILNGTDSRSISGLLISSLPPISKPQVRTQIETVDGRDGDIVTPLGFSAYDKVINIGLTYNYDVDEIIEFFNSEGIVTFSNEPDKYYRYAIYEQIDFEKLIRFKTAEVVLHVQPFKFSTTEEPELFDVVSGQAIAVTNEGNTDSRPNLTIIGSGDIDVSLNGSQILSLELADNQAVIIDSEDMNAYGAQSAIREVEADIEPIQDLNGYNSVWIGGAGKNKINVADKTQQSSGYLFSNYAIELPSGDWTLSFNSTATSGQCNFIIKNGSTDIANKTVNLTNGRVSISVTTTQSSTRIECYINTSGTFSKIMLENNSTATSFEPYENICDISGSTELEVVDCGCNLWDEDWELGAIVWTTGQPTPATDRIRSKNYCYIKGGKNYYIKVDTSKSGTPFLFYYDKNQNYISNTSADTIINRVISIPDNAVFFKLAIVSTTTYNNNISINYPSTDTNYHTYNGSANIINISINQWNEQTRSGYYKTDGTFQSYSGNLANTTPVSVKPNTKYRFLVEGGSGAIGRVCWYNSSMTFISYQDAQQANAELTSPDNAYYMNFDLTGAYGTTYNNDVSINYPATFTDYYPYTDIGTVYGGHLNVTTGELTIDRVLSRHTWGEFTSKTVLTNYTRGQLIVTDEGTGINTNPTDICNLAPFKANYSSDDCHFYVGVGGANTVIYVFLPNNASNDTIIQVCYKLADPITIQLTPVQINNLLGLNNMYTDNSGDLTVKHKSNGVIVTDTGAVVSFYAGLDDIEKGVLLNRAITGDYDKIRLRKGVNTFVLTGNAQQFAIDKFSRWI